MQVYTKIICTIGPSISSYEKIVALIRAGMNVARLNFSHGTYKEHQQHIDWLKKARTELGISLGIMLDTRGPEIRIGDIKGGVINLKAGQKWHIQRQACLGDDKVVSIYPSNVIDSLTPGATLLLNDGYLSATVTEKHENHVVVCLNNGGAISSGKGLNIPDLALDLPALSERDIEDLAFGCKNDIDIVAASFIRTPENVIAIKDVLLQAGKSDILVIAKIESKEGVKNFDSIVQVADGVMIARGDLGVELPLSQVPKLQKEMIRKCYLMGKPSITATQMLESMMQYPRPTRAEVSDVANAIYDSTSCVMLSGETAAGKYPIEVVEMMKKIVMETESDFNYQAFFNEHSSFVYNDVPSSVTLATVKTAYSSGAQAIFALTQRGSTARLLSRLRPGMPIVAMTPSEKCYHQLSLNWGIIPYLAPEAKDYHDGFEKLSSFAIQKNVVSYGDLVVVTAGSTFGVTGTTNMMIVESIGDVLVRAHAGIGHKIYGNISLLLTPEGKRPYQVRDCLIVIPKCDASYLDHVKESKGVIMQNSVDDQESEAYLFEVAQKFQKPALVRADYAINILKEGGLVTIDPEKALVYKGVVV